MTFAVPALAGLVFVGFITASLDISACRERIQRLEHEVAALRRAQGS